MGFVFLRELYNREEAAFFSNVGNLVMPTTKAQMRSGQVQTCVSLFSHSNQQNGAQTLKCQEMGEMAKGVGGRIADALSTGTENYVTSSFSLAGSAVWPKGFFVNREMVDSRNQDGFHEYEKWRETIINITQQRHSNPYSDVFTQAFLDSIVTTENLGRVLLGAGLITNYARNTGLQRSLYQVAKLIAARDPRNAERDFFFVQTGGWDMHSNMKNSLANRFREIDDALRGFVAEMEAQRIWDSIVFITSSEFARTLDSNGGGSDHAWAGNHIIAGGGIRGKRIFNRFAELKIGNAADLGRGRLVPGFPWESMMVPIAQWMGMQEDQVAATFPNLQNFNRSLHVVTSSALFKP